MRRLVHAFVCAVVLWFGVMEFGGGMIYKGEAAREQVVAPFAESVTHQFERQPLFGEPVGTVTDNEIDADRIDESSIVDVDGPDGGNAVADAVLAAEDDANRKTVYLTFDDGPSQYTPQVLDILKAEGIKATFFVLGQQVVRNPDIAKRIVDEGHSIGNHTFNHVYAELYGSFGEFASQVMKTDDAIYAATGVRTTLLRAPGGTHTNFDQSYFDALAAAGYRVHDWNVDSGDSKRRGVPAAEIIANVKASRIADTLNVLLHDSGGHEQSVKALPAIINYYKELGYSFKALNDGVEPMQFTIAKKLKWNRPAATLEQRTELINYAQSLDRSGSRAEIAGQVPASPQKASAEQGTSKVSGAGALGAAAKGALPQEQSNLKVQRDEPALIVHRGEKKLTLEADEYTLINGSIYVPLLKLTEWMDGIAEIDEETGIIEAVMRGRQLFWMIGSRSQDGMDEQRRIDVPIRATLAQFGIGIADYVYTADQREVWIEE